MDDDCRNEFSEWFAAKPNLEHPYSGDAPTGFQAGFRAGLMKREVVTQPAPDGGSGYYGQFCCPKCVRTVMMHQNARQCAQCFAELAAKRESGWVSVKKGLPQDFDSCLIWLKPVNGNGESHWSVRKGSFRNGSFSEWGENKPYTLDTYKRITHWRPHYELPPTNEIEDRRSTPQDTPSPDRPDANLSVRKTWDGV